MGKKTFIVLAILGLLFGIASPLPIWPGPLSVKHLALTIVSAVLMMLACFGAIRENSKDVGTVAIIYGTLTSLIGITTATSPEFLAEDCITVIIGSIVSLIVGITAIILGIKIYAVQNLPDKEESTSTRNPILP
jgi:FtsH-binding integral membrane protein